MRRAFLFLAALPIAGSWAQVPRAIPAVATPQQSVAGSSMHTLPAGKGRALDVVFNEDFANGLTGNSGFGAWTTAGPDGGLWLYDTNGPNGDFSNPAAEKIQSTTVANGFMIFDSNLSNPGGVTNNRVGYLQSPVLDLSATPDVQLKFEQRYRWCCSGDPGHWLEVSLDGGLSWTFRVNVADGTLHLPTATNWDIGTHTKWIDLSTMIAGSPGNVVFRFSHEDLTPPSISHYFWEIDDVQLIATPSFDPQFTIAQYDNFIPSDLVFGGNTVDLEYTIYPFSQVHNTTIKGRIRNGGTEDLGDVGFHAVITDPSSTTVFDQTGTIASLPRYAQDSISFEFPLPTVEGEYTVNFNVQIDSTDDHPIDNSFVKQFAMDTFLYAYDDGVMNGRTNTQGGDAFEICNKFFIHNTTDLYAIRAAFAKAPAGSTDAIGALFSGSIYDGLGAWLGLTGEYFLESSDLNNPGQSKFVDLLLDDPLNLTPGEYLVCIHYDGGDPVWLATSGISEFGSSIEAQPTVQDASAQFFLQNNTPMIRLNFDPNVGDDTGIQEATAEAAGLEQNQPNPCDQQTMINYHLAKASDVRLDLFDVSGQRVRSADQGVQAAGRHTFQLDTSALPEGIYFYQLSAGGTQLTERMTVIH